MSPRLRRVLHPVVMAERKLVRILLRLVHAGVHPRIDCNGRPWPYTFAGVVGNALERRAARRKVGGWRHLPLHVGKKRNDVSYLRKLRGAP